MKEATSNRWKFEPERDPMKTTLVVLMSAILSTAYAADPASGTTSPNGGLKTISEKAMAAQQEALAIHDMMKAKQPNLTAAAERAATLDKHVGELHEAVKSMESGLTGPDGQQLKASVEVLKVLTETKVKRLSEAQMSDRGTYRATAKNIAMRAEQILKTSRKIGG